MVFSIEILCPLSLTGNGIMWFKHGMDKNVSLYDGVTGLFCRHDRDFTG